MPTYSTKQQNKKNKKEIRITNEKDQFLFFFLKTLDVVSKNINAYTTLDQKSRTILNQSLISNGVMLIEMQLFSESLYPFVNEIEDQCKVLFETSRFQVFVSPRIKMAIKDKHSNSLYIHQLSVPVFIKYLQEKYSFVIEKSSYKEQIQSIIKKYM